MTIAYDASNGLTGTADTASPFGAVTRSTPSMSAGGYLIISTMGKPYDTDWSISGDTLSDSDLLEDFADGTTAQGNGTGSIGGFTWGKRVTANPSAQTLTPDAQYNPWSRISLAFSNDTGLWDVAHTHGGDASATGTSFSASFAAQVGAQAQDMLVAIVGMTDDTASPSSPTLTIPGCTLGSLTARLSTNSTTAGNDMFMEVYTCTVSSGSQSGNGSFTASVTSGDSQGVVHLIRLREASAALQLMGWGVLL